MKPRDGGCENAAPKTASTRPYASRLTIELVNWPWPNKRFTRANTRVLTSDGSRGANIGGLTAHVARVPCPLLAAFADLECLQLRNFPDRIGASEKATGRNGRNGT